MPKQTPHPPITKRLAALWPRLAPVVEAVQPAPSANTAKQYRNATRRMAEGEQWPEEIGKPNRKSFNYYRAALVFCTVEDVRKDYAKITNEADPISLVEAEGLIYRLKKFLGILQRYPPQGGEGDC